MHIATRQVGKVTVLDCTGRLTLGRGAPLLRSTVHGLINKGRKRILLNLAEVSHIDDSGIGVLVAGFTITAKEGGTLKLVNVSDDGKELLHLTEFDTIFEVFDDEDRAVRSFS
jgi:anti-sigma B factor antagonist